MKSTNEKMEYKEFWDSLTQKQRKRVLFGDVRYINFCSKRDWDKIPDDVKNKYNIYTFIDHHIMRNNLEKNFTDDIVNSVKNRDYWEEGWLM